LKKEDIKMKTTSYLAHYRKVDCARHSVKTHSVETSLFAKKFAGKIRLDLIGELLGLLHDLGKYSFEYQCYIKSAVGLLCPGDKQYVDAKRLKGKIDHSTAGAQWINEALRDAVKINKLASEIVALCVVSHHSGLIDVFDIAGEDKFSARLKKDFTLTHYCEAQEKIDHSILDRINELIKSEDKNNQLKRLIIRIHELFSGPIRSFSKTLLVRFLFSSLVDADRLSTADFENPEDARLRYLGNYPDWQNLIDCFELISFEIENEVDQKRCEISSSCRQRASDKQGLYYLTVPTGGGKTFFSLRFALHHAKEHELDRIIYVIPYTSIIDQNASEVAKIFDGISKEIVLEHHSNLVPEKDTYRNRILSENWDAPIVFTTSVQLLETLFGGGTRSVRRMHQLAKSVIIFDEIQTLPIKTVHMFNNAINTLAMYTYLADVEYQVQAHFEWNLFCEDMAADRIDGKHFQIAKRMIDKGGRQDIFLGTRECQGYIEPCGFGEGTGAYDDIDRLDYGIMFHGFDYPDETGKTDEDGKPDESGKYRFHSRFWKPVMQRGVIKFIRPEECTMRKFVREMIPNPPQSDGLNEEALQNELD